MKHLLTVAAAIFALSAAPALAGAKTYQVTGPALEVTNDKITVQKDKDKWEINRGSAEVPADVKVGSKVTIEYSMTAAKVITKNAGKEAPKKK